MKPGIYPDLSMDDYHGSDAVGSSSLRLAGRSIDHYRAYLETGIEETKSMRIGTAVHYAVLEPDKFQRRYIDSQPPLEFDNWRHKKTAIMASLGMTIGEIADELSIKPKTITGYLDREEVQAMIEHYEAFPPDDCPDLSGEEMDIVRRCQEAVLTHPVASEMVESATKEISHFWKDEGTGILCKCRPDMMIDQDIIVDLKTCQDARPDAFQRSVAKWGYHAQAAWYREGVKQAAGDDRPNFLFLCVETGDVAGVSIYHCDSELMERGHAAAMECLDAIHGHRSGRDKWTGYPTEITPLSLPAWA